MKRLYFGTVLLILFSAASVKSGSVYTVDEVFENFRRAYEESQNFSAAFEETTFRGATKNLTQGHLVFSKPNLIRKEYVNQKDSTQALQIIVLDGTYSWSYTPMLNQVNKMKWNNSNRRELLPGIGTSLQDVRKNYNMRLIVDELAEQRGICQLELNPKPHMFSQSEGDSHVGHEVLEIWIRTTDWLPMQFGYKFEGDAGNSTSVIVSLENILRDQDLDGEIFKFVIPAGVEVINLSSEN